MSKKEIKKEKKLVEAEGKEIANPTPKQAKKVAAAKAAFSKSILTPGQGVDPFDLLFGRGSLRHPGDNTWVEALGAAAQRGAANQNALANAIGAAVSGAGAGPSSGAAKIVARSFSVQPKKTLKEKAVTALKSGATAMTAHLRGKLAALARINPDECSPTPACSYTDSINPEVTCRKTVFRASVTLAQTATSADAAYYGMIYAHGLPGNHSGVVPMVASSNPAQFNIGGRVSNSDPLVTAIGANTENWTCGGICLRINDTTALQSVGGVCLMGNLTYSEMKANTLTFNQLLARDSVKQATTTSEKVCYTWNPGSSVDIAPAIYTADATGDYNTWLVAALKSDTAQTIYYEVITHWTVQPLPSYVNVYGASHQAVDQGAFNDAFAKLEGTEAPQMETESQSKTSFFQDVKALGKDAWNWVKSSVGDAMMDGGASALSSLFTDHRAESISRQLAQHSGRTIRDAALPPGFQDALNALLRYRILVKRDLVAFESLDTKERWVTSADTKTDIFGDSETIVSTRRIQTLETADHSESDFDQVEVGGAACPPAPQPPARPGMGQLLTLPLMTSVVKRT